MPSCDLERSISVDKVKMYCMNVSFADWAWKYTRTISHTKKEILDKMKNDSTNFFKYVSASDLAYAMMVFFNNKKKWEADIRAAKKGKESNKKRKNAGKKSGKSSGEEVVVRQRWSGQKKNQSFGHGYSDEGVKFYSRLVRIFAKEIKVNEWEEIWEEYWAEVGSRYIKPRQVDKPMWKTYDGPEDDLGACNLFMDDDDYNDDNGGFNDVTVEPV